MRILLLPLQSEQNDLNLPKLDSSMLILQPNMTIEILKKYLKEKLKEKITEENNTMEFDIGIYYRNVEMINHYTIRDIERIYLFTGEKTIFYYCKKFSENFIEKKKEGVNEDNKNVKMEINENDNNNNNEAINENENVEVIENTKRSFKRSLTLENKKEILNFKPSARKKAVFDIGGRNLINKEFKTRKTLNPETFKQNNKEFLLSKGNYNTRLSKINENLFNFAIKTEENQKNLSSSESESDSDSGSESKNEEEKEKQNCNVDLNSMINNVNEEKKTNKKRSVFIDKELDKIRKEFGRSNDHIEEKNENEKEKKLNLENNINEKIDEKEEEEDNEKNSNADSNFFSKNFYIFFS